MQLSLKRLFDDRANFTAQTVSPEIRAAVDEVIEALDNGSLRVAQKLMASGLFTNGSKAVLLSFKINDNKPMNAGELGFMTKWTPNLMAGQKKISKMQARVSFPCGRSQRFIHRQRCGYSCHLIPTSVLMWMRGRW